MRMKTVILSIIMYSLVLSLHSQAAESDINFRGTLISEPCTVTENDIVIDFGTIPNKNFYDYMPPRTWLKSFQVALKDCDLSLGNQVKVMFTGMEDAEQHGRLAVTGIGVKNIAVGIQGINGKDIPINKQTESYPLSAGTTILKFKSYIQASSAGIKNHAVGLGSFEATASFVLEYP